MMFTLQLVKIKHREGKCLGQGYTVSEQLNQAVPESVLLNISQTSQCGTKTKVGVQLIFVE